MMLIHSLLFISSWGSSVIFEDLSIPIHVECDNLKLNVYPVWSHIIQQQVLPLRKFCPFKYMLEVKPWNSFVSCHLYLKPYATTDWCCNYFLPCKEFRSHQNCGFLKHRKTHTENQVNPVAVNCWMKNWNGAFVMCALHNEMNPHTPKNKKNPICFGESSLLFCSTHSLIL